MNAYASHMHYDCRYRPCIRGEGGKVLWQHPVGCKNRDHSTVKGGVSAHDYAKLFLEAARDPSRIEKLLACEPPLFNNSREMGLWLKYQQAYRMAIEFAEDVRRALGMVTVAA